MKRLLIADDHALVLEGICKILQSEYEIAGTARDGRQVVAMAEELRPDLVVLDVSMPELNGVEASRKIRRVLPSAKVVFVTQQLGPEYIRAAFDAGATGYVAKQSASTELLEAVRLALRGKTFLTPLATLKSAVPGTALKARGSDQVQLAGGRLTPRQREVLQLIAEGKTAKEVGTALGISVKTVEFHRNALMDELGIRTTAELTRYALLHGIIE